MAKQTGQVKDAIRRLRAAGFDRKDFSVNVERIHRHYDGQRFYEWGEAKIFMRCEIEKTLQKTRLLQAQGFGVTHVIGRGAKIITILVSDSYETRGKLTLMDLRGHDLDHDRCLQFNHDGYGLKGNRE